jgi:protein tyrosine/serine phosphatase
VRSNAPSKLTPEGWDALKAHGIRTIITLRTGGITENELDIPDVPSGIETVSKAIEDLSDPEFLHKWAATDLWCTPLYYQDALMRWPKRHTDVVAAFAQAQPGGVLIHCVRGTDRTGIIIIMLLALAGVPAGEIAADYELSPDPEREEILRAHDTSSRGVILETLANMDAETYLLAAGLSPSVLETASERLLEPINF